MKAHEEHYKRVKEELTALLKKLCTECPHQHDTHQMNCIECCVNLQVLEDLAGLKGTTVIKGSMKIYHLTDKEQAGMAKQSTD
jgi:hypothetical protein